MEKFLPSLQPEAEAKGSAFNFQQYYLSLLKELPIALYTCNKDGYITFYNDHAAKLWGRSPEVGKDLWTGFLKIFRPDGSPMPLDECPMARALKTGMAIADEEIIIERPDGSRLNIVPYPQPIRDAFGNLDGALNMLTDVTERKISEESRFRMAAIVASSDDAVISKSLEGIVTSWNASAERIFGYTSEEMLGQPIIKLIPFDRLNEETTILQRLQRGERVDHFETRRLTKDGRLIDISLTISPVKDHSGKIIGASKIARDITQMKIAERMIRRGEEQFRMAVEATNLGAWDYDPVSGELTWSSECRKIYGLPDDIPVNYELFSLLLHPDDAQRVQQAVEKAVHPTGNAGYDIVFRIKRYDTGEFRWIRSQGKVYFTEEGLAQSFIGTVLDITEDKTTKEALEKAVADRTAKLRSINEELERSNAELERFASIASHDLQEPLRKIQTYVDLVSTNSDRHTLQKYFPKIVSSATRMSQLIKDVLHYSMLTQKKDLVYEMVDLEQLFSEIRDDFELVIEEKKARIESEKLPVIAGYRSQLQQLFANLLSNALKFSKDEPQIRVSARTIHNTDTLTTQKTRSANESIVEIRISDNGIGFNQKYEDQVFEIFQRLEDKQTYSGTGIGLAICKKIVENHKGTISVDSKEGVGTTFIIRLPVQQKT